MKKVDFAIKFLIVFVFFAVFSYESSAATPAFVSCASDGSSSGEACSAEGNYGLCNGAGNCVDTKSGPICKSDGSSSGKPCVVNGNYGLCNGAGNCVDTNGGPIPVSKKQSTTTSNSASNTTNFSGGTNFTNPLKFSTVEDFLGGIMTAIQRIIVVLALVSITIGAVMILASAGSSGMVERGKAAITMALVGLAIGLAAPSLLKELANIVGWGGAVPAALTLSEIAVRVLNFLLGTMGIVALVMMVIGAIMYLTSAGDEDRIGQGKDIFKYSLIGVVAAMSAMVLVTQVARFFQ